jgi:hypothetical protein
MRIERIYFNIKDKLIIDYFFFFKKNTIILENKIKTIFKIKIILM